MRVRKLSLGGSFNGHNANSARMASKVVNSYRLLLGLLSSILLLSGCAYIGPASPLGFKSALAQVNSLQSFNPFSPDFLSLAIGLTPQLHGVNLDLSRVQDTVSCDLTLPITYVNPGCMSELQLLLPITVSNSSHQNQTVLYEGNATLTPISLSIGVTSDNITAGETQTVTVTTTNASSGANILGAEVNLNVTDSSGTTIHQENATSDSVGQTSFTFTVPSDASVGTFQVDVRASAPGYEPAFETSTFGVIGLDSSFDNSTNFDNSSSDSGSSSSDGSSSSGGSSSSSNNDFTSPEVKSTSPSDGDNNVPLDTDITVNFNEKIDKNTIDTGSLTLVNLHDTLNPDIQDVSVSSKSATFTLRSTTNGQALVPNTDYEATISSNIEDQNGNFLDCSASKGVDSNCSWQFHTAVGSPAIIINPTSGPILTSIGVTGTGFDPSSGVTVTFGGTTVTTATTTSTGSFTANFNVPLSSSIGDNTVKATQGPNSASAKFTVTKAVITLDPTSGTVGSPFTVTGTGFDPNTDVTIDFDGSTGTKKSDSNGDFTVTFGVPASTSGVHIIEASEGSKSASKPFTVVSSISLDPTSGPVGTSVNVTGNGFNSTSPVDLKIDSTALSPASTDNKGSFSSAFTAPALAVGPHNVTATQGSNTASQSFTVTSSISSVKALGNRVNSSFAVSNSSSNASNLTNSSKPISSNLTVRSNTPESEKAHTQFSTSGGNKTSSISEGNVLRLQTPNNNTSVSSSAGAKNASIDKNMTSSTLTESNKQVQMERSQVIHQSASEVKRNHVKEQLLNNKVVNIAPIAKDDIATTKEKTAVNIAVLKNDIDTNNDNKLNIVGLSPPLHGTVVSNSNGTFTYVPKPSWTGTDVFAYSVTNGHGGIASSEVKVSVEPTNTKNHIPKAQSQSVPLKENSHAKILLKGKDSDKDPLSFDIVEKPSHGTIAEFSSLSGSLVYIPDGNYVGHDTFTFKVSDGNADSNTAKVSLRVIADKNAHQTKTPTLKPNLLHEPQPQTPQQNNNPSSNQQQPQPDPQELKKIENQAEKQVLNQQPPSQQEQPSGGNDNGQSKQQNEQSSQQDGSSSQPQ